MLLDIRMPEGDGLTSLGRIKLDKPEMPILILSTFDNPTYVARAVALGANGYLLKGALGMSYWRRSALRPPARAPGPATSFAA